MRHHNVHIWLRLARLADDPFHPSHTFARRMSSVLIIVHRKLDEEQIDLPLGQHLRRQPKSSGSGASRGNARINKIKLRFREPLLKPRRHHRPIPIHLRDRAAHKRHPPGL